MSDNNIIDNKKQYLTIESLEKRKKIAKPIAKIDKVQYNDKYHMVVRLNKSSNNIYINKSIRKPINKKSLIPSSSSLNSFRNGLIYDQGQLGSCTANAFCMANCILNKVANKNVSFRPSRLFFYYQERVILGTINEDSGAYVVDGLSYVKVNGICSEKLWPYNISKFAVNPSPNCYVEALKYKISSYSIIPINANLLTSIKNAILNKKPVLIAIAVYDSFETINVAKTGMVPLPNVNSEQCLGGHEMCLIGFDDNKKLFTVVNSWGSTWGVNGLCYIPYTYITDPNLSFEFTMFSV